MIIMTKGIYILVLLVSFFSAGITRGQDINFSQFYELPLLRNPALAGIYKGDIRFTSAFRNQWQAVPVRYMTTAAGVETKIKIKKTKDYISIGAQLTNDVAGDGRLGKTQVLPILAYHKMINSQYNMYLTAGFIGGGVSQRFDPTKLRFGDQFVDGTYSTTNPTNATFANTSITYWDASTGLCLSGAFGRSKYYIGAAYFHFNEPKVAFSALNDIRLNRKYVLNAGLSTKTSDYGDYLTLYADFFSQGRSRQLQGGAMYKHVVIEDAKNEEDIAFSFGAFYRWEDAVVPVVKLNYRKWGIGSSYDINVSSLRSASQWRGGIEFTLSFKSFLNINNTTLNQLECPIDFW
jgi:type IX secretion system PorP/SprF family membrane protein